jgi:hypothetical protein
MAVYKKDGTIYKLNGPNQIMFSQENWSCFTTYNLKNISNFKIESDIPHVIIGSKKEPSQRKDIISPIVENEIKVENVVDKESIPVENKSIIKEPVVIEKEKNEFDGFDKTIIYCALAKRVEIKDDLYGETKLKIKFIEKFTFEAIVLSKNDFTFIFWTRIDKLTVNSVLYPQDDSKRWWEIKEIDSVPGGYKIACVITRNTPSF